jgi:hypothetical protein
MPLQFKQHIWFDGSDVKWNEGQGGGHSQKICAMEVFLINKQKLCMFCACHVHLQHFWKIFEKQFLMYA